MIRMTWRQHRLQLAVSAALLAALAGYLWWSGRRMSSYSLNIGLTGCLARHAQCGPLITAFHDRFGDLPAGFTLLALIPMPAGLFWGAPLIARELETGTFRLAWTQSVSRSRWLTVKFAAFIATALLAAAFVSLLITWWLRPLEAISFAGQTANSRLSPVLFSLSGTVPIATTLFAFALGTAAGAVIRRTVPAMAVTVGGFLAAWLPMQSLRYHLLAPSTVTTHFNGGAPAPTAGSYVLSTGQADAAGRPVPFTDLLSACGVVHNGEYGLDRSSNACLGAKGFQFTETFQPYGRYWPLQGIETGVYLTAAVALLALAAWWTTRRLR